MELYACDTLNVYLGATAHRFSFRGPIYVASKLKLNFVA
jgi:hypothetical protein